MGLGLGALSAFAPRAAEAQQTSLYLDRLVMAGAPDDAIGMWRPTMGEKTRFYGQLGLGFSYLPFRIENDIHNPTTAAQVAGGQPGVAAGGAPVDDQLIMYADLGVEIVSRFGLQIQLPVVLYQHTNPTNDPSLGASDAVGGQATAPMDTRINARFVAFRNDARTFKAGIDGSVWIPTGSTTAWGSDGSTTTGLGLALEYDFRVAFLLANAGFHFRPTATINDFQSSSEFVWGGGIFFPLRGGAARIGAQVFGSVGLAGGSNPRGPDATVTPVHAGTTSFANIPAEWMAEGRFALDKRRRAYIGIGGGTRIDQSYGAPDLRVVALLGYSFSISDTDPPAPARRFQARYAEHGGDFDHDGIPDDIDLCPTEPEDHKPPDPDDGCPAPPDRDGDGIPDSVDKCPDVPEDKDGIQDADGCPEDDADKDGIPDAQDACPLEPGEPDPDPKKNGCPKFIRRITGSSEIQILKQVQFATGKATILKNSFPILDEVVRLLKVNVDILHLDIEGHTDNRGSDDLNEKLSNDRANSVMRYISEHGIDAGRLAAAGYGPKRPIADNNTADGRQTNRRVEFHIRNDKAFTPGTKAEGAAPEQMTPPPGSTAAPQLAAPPAPTGPELPPDTPPQFKLPPPPEPEAAPPVDPGPRADPGAAIDKGTRKPKKGPGETPPSAPTP